MAKKSARSADFTIVGTLSFPRLHEASQIVMNGQPTGPKKFSCLLFVEPEEWKKVVDQHVPDLLPWFENDEPKDPRFGWPHFEGKTNNHAKGTRVENMIGVRCSANENYAPKVLKKVAGKFEPMGEAEVYSGMKVAISGNLYTRSMPMPGGLSMNINGLLKVADDERLDGGGFDEDSAFNDIKVEDDAGGIPGVGAVSDEPAGALPSGIPGIG